MWTKPHSIQVSMVLFHGWIFSNLRYYKCQCGFQLGFHTSVTEPRSFTWAVYSANCFFDQSTPITFFIAVT